MNIYDSTIPVFLKNLKNVLGLLDVAERCAKQKKFDVSVILGSRLAPDQFNFIQQVQYMYYHAIYVASHISGKKLSDFAYEEKTMRGVRVEVKRAIAFLKTIRPKDVEGKEKAKIPYFFDVKKSVDAESYLLNVSLPNFFFHYTIAYEILRHLGVPIGIDEYMGPLPGIKQQA